MSSVYQVMVLLGYIDPHQLLYCLGRRQSLWRRLLLASNAVCNLSQSSQSACMDGNNKSAPASSNTCLSSGPVLTATVNMPAAVPACTPIGAFSTTIASLACTPAFPVPLDKAQDEAFRISHQRRSPCGRAETYQGSCGQGGSAGSVGPNR